MEPFAAVLLWAVVAGRPWRQGITNMLSFCAVFGFFALAPVVVWKGSRIEVTDNVVRARRGIGRWWAIPRLDVRAVHQGRQPWIKGFESALVLKAVWTDDQLRDLAAVLGVPFVPRQRQLP